MHLVSDKLHSRHLREKMWWFSLVNEHMIFTHVLETIGGNLKEGFSYESKKLKILVLGIGENESFFANKASTTWN